MAIFSIFHINIALYDKCFYYYNTKPYIINKMGDDVAQWQPYEA